MKLARAFDAFCYGLRLKSETRHTFYWIGALLLLLVAVSIENSRYRPSPARMMPSAVRIAQNDRPAYLQPGHGTECIDSYSNLQNQVYEGLNSESNKILLFSQTCKTQRKTLQLLARYPRDQRDEILARLFDVAAGSR